MNAIQDDHNELQILIYSYHMINNMLLHHCREIKTKLASYLASCSYSLKHVAISDYAHLAT